MWVLWAGAVRLSVHFCAVSCDWFRPGGQTAGGALLTCLGSTALGVFAGGRFQWMGGARCGGVGLPVSFAGGRGCGSRL